MTEFAQLSRQGKLSRYRRACTEALRQYPFEVKRLRFVSMNNAAPVFRADTNRGSFSAKFHDPTESTLEQMHGEMEFLEHLAQCPEVAAERPLANSSGRFVTEVNTGFLPQPANVALRSWLPGRHLKDWSSPRSYRWVGKCAALLHEAAESFRPTEAFNIHRMDRVFYWDKETVLSRRDPALLPRSRQDLFRQAARRAEDVVARAWRSERPIVIHNDLHPCNVKLYQRSPSIYDFEDIAWGTPQQDIGVAMYHVRCGSDYDRMLGAFRAGYEEGRPWPFDSRRDLDPFIIARLIMFANYTINYDLHPEKHLPAFEAKLRAMLAEDMA